MATGASITKAGWWVVILKNGDAVLHKYTGAGSVKDGAQAYFVSTGTPSVTKVQQTVLLPNGITTQKASQAIGQVLKNGTGILGSTSSGGILQSIGNSFIPLPGLGAGVAAGADLTEGAAATDAEEAGAEDASAAKDENDDDESTKSGSGVNPSTLAKGLETTALGAFLAAWGPIRILKLIAGMLLLFLALKQMTTLGNQGTPSA